MNKKERDYRLNILNGILTTPHRDHSKLAGLHADVICHDLTFYGCLAVWYMQVGKVKDHKEAFIANLLASKDPQYREAGAALLQQLPPYQVERVLTYMKKYIGKVPRSTRTAVQQYLRKRESNDTHFDAAAVRARKALKGLYSSLHIKPSERADKILFKNDPPPGSLPAVVKEIAKTESPTAQAQILVQHKVPYPIAVGIVKNMTPTVMVALINAMTPSEVINNIKTLKSKGALDHPEVKKLVDNKLKAAQKDKRVSALKATVASKDLNADADTLAALAAVTDTQIKSTGSIGKATALFIDKSGSMNIAIELGKQVAALVCGISEADFYCYTFDTVPKEVKVPRSNRSLSAWSTALSKVHAGGGTSCGCPFVLLTKHNHIVEQIIVITDEDENSAPYFAKAWKEYSKEFGVEPSVVIIRTPRHATKLSNSLQSSNIEFQTWKFDGDYYSLPNLVPLLAGKSRLDLLMEIMAYELPVRKPTASNLVTA